MKHGVSTGAVLLLTISACPDCLCKVLINSRVSTVSAINKYTTYLLNQSPSYVSLLPFNKETQWLGVVALWL